MSNGASEQKVPSEEESNRGEKEKVPDINLISLSATASKEASRAATPTSMETTNAAKRKRQDMEEIEKDITAGVKKRSTSRKLMRYRVESAGIALEGLLEEDPTKAKYEQAVASFQQFAAHKNEVRTAHDSLIAYLIEVGAVEKEIADMDSWLTTWDRQWLESEANMTLKLREWRQVLYPQQQPQAAAGDANETDANDTTQPPSVMDITMASEIASNAQSQSMERVLRGMQTMQLEESARREKEFRRVQSARDEELAKTQASLLQGLLIPKITVPTFEGGLMDDYRGWIHSFNSVYKEEALGPEVCFCELKNHLKGEALLTVEGVRSDKDCMEVAMALLDDRFGDKKLNYTRLVQEYKSLDVCTSVNDVVKLRQMLNKVSAMDRTAKAIRKKGDSTTISMWLEKLPIALYEKWEGKLADDKADPDDTAAFRELLKREVRVRESVAPFVKARQDAKPEKKKAESKSGSASAQNAPAGATGAAGATASGASGRALVAQTNQGAKKKGPKKEKRSREEAIKATGVDFRNCAGCEDEHDLSECKTFKENNLQQRWDFVKSKRCCMACLRRGHGKYVCKVKKKCNINGCDQEHHPMLHG